jgi:hypothetical protein
MIWGIATSVDCRSVVSGTGGAAWADQQPAIKVADTTSRVRRPDRGAAGIWGQKNLQEGTGVKNGMLRCVSGGVLSNFGQFSNQRDEFIFKFYSYFDRKSC